MNVGERAVEIAERNVELERDRRVAGIRAALDEEGNELCASCGEEIGEARRKALPSATRCIGCQAAFERRGY